MLLRYLFVSAVIVDATSASPDVWKRQANQDPKIIDRPVNFLPDEAQNVLKDGTGTPLNTAVSVVLYRRPGNDTAWVEKDFTWSKTWLYGSDEGQRQTKKAVEASAYLSYIIENYESLPEATAFVTPTRYFGIAPRFDTLNDLRNLNTSNIIARGSSALRCSNVIDVNAWEDCHVDPRHLAEASNDSEGPKPEQIRLATIHDQTAWFRFLSEGDNGMLHSLSCCPRFAVSAEALRQRTLKDYERQRDALMMR
ncbi:Hypothetical protein D9617_4g001770 [Elsinoe fawcettii]|nr:Hypothetical protein D9617_4g001770 [Elsinoe fawcettii]